MSESWNALVGGGFDEIADEYLEWTSHIHGDPKVVYLGELMKRLPRRARVLELGCGAGEPCTRLLAGRFRVSGVDVSAEQIRRARRHVPGADFVHADFTESELEPGVFDAVAAFYVLNHVPRDLLAAVFGRIHRWLAPGGLFLASLGTSDTASWIGEWLGTTMFFSGWDPETNRELLRAAGFELLIDDLVAVTEPQPDGDSTFQWVLAKT